MSRRLAAVLFAGAMTIAAAILPTAAQASTAKPATPAVQAVPKGSALPTAGLTLWCGSWLKDVTATHNVEDLARGLGPDGGTWHVRYGWRNSNNLPYIWAMLTSAKPGDQIALIWQYKNNGEWYQCGDAANHRTATVGSSPYSTSTIARTAGVPASQVQTYDCRYWNLANQYGDCL
jgi:hypothetical protein